FTHTHSYDTKPRTLHDALPIWAEEHELQRVHLREGQARQQREARRIADEGAEGADIEQAHHPVLCAGEDHCLLAEAGTCVGQVRSEEHTSELQSRENLVCRLLL